MIPDYPVRFQAWARTEDGREIVVWDQTFWTHPWTVDFDDDMRRLISRTLITDAHGRALGRWDARHRREVTYGR